MKRKSSYHPYSSINNIIRGPVYIYSSPFAWAAREEEITAWFHTTNFIGNQTYRAEEARPHFALSLKRNWNHPNHRSDPSRGLWERKKEYFK